MKSIRKNDKIKTLVMTKERFESIKEKLGKFILKVIVVGGLVFIICIGALNLNKACTENFEQFAILHKDDVITIDSEAVYQNWAIVEDESVIFNPTGKVQELFGKIRNIKINNKISDLSKIEEKIKYAADFKPANENIREAAEFK